MTPDTNATELEEAQTIVPGDEVEAVVTVEDGTVLSSVGGRKVTFPNLAQAALELGEGELLGIRFVVRKPIYGRDDLVDSIFVQSVVDSFDPAVRRDEGNEKGKTVPNSRANSSPNQRLGRSRTRFPSTTNPAMMRELVQGKL